MREKDMSLKLCHEETLPLEDSGIQISEHGSINDTK